MRKLLILFCFCVAISAANKWLAHEPVGVTVFRNGEHGYPCIRTPAIIKTNSSLLAFAGTRCGSGDGCNPHDATTVDHMDTVMKLSLIHI